MNKCYQHDTKMRSKINGKSMNFQNLRFLGFCEEYNVKIVFLHDQGGRNQSKIDGEKNEKVCENASKMMPKRGPKSMANL